MTIDAAHIDTRLRAGVTWRVIAGQQSKRLVEAHERFSALTDKQHFQVVCPMLPMDLLGIYILLPE